MRRLRVGGGRVVAVVSWCTASSVWASLACTPAFDVIGVGEDVYEHRAQTLQGLSDKSPEYDPERTITEQFDGCSLTLNKSAAVTRLSISKLDGDDADLNGVIFPTRLAALEALGKRQTIASMEVVNGALKPFNDGLYAAIELAVEEGANGSLVDKRAVLDELLETMLERSQTANDPAGEAAADFLASFAIVGDDTRSSSAFDDAVSADIDDFEAHPFRSTPIGFYTWSEPLERVFKRDRFLQYSLADRGADSFAPTSAVADALGANEGLREDYQRLLQLYSGLTNPSWHYSPLDLADFADARAESEISRSSFEAVHPELTYGDSPCAAGYSWMPPSESPERKLLAEDYCNGTPPTNLLARLIEAIQTGEIDLTPTGNSGWYDWQLYALETLLVPELAPENEHLLLTQAYKDKLLETFKSLLIQTRETHVKQLGVVTMPSSAPPPPVDVYPLLPVEPFPTFYLRTARAYEFVSHVLSATLGEDAMSSISRLYENGERSQLSLSEELHKKRELLYGLHLVAAASIGMADSLTQEEREALDLEAVEADARVWLSRWQSDPDVAVDPRVQVPLVLDAEARVMRNLGVVGVKVIRMHASFPKGYEPKVVSGWCEVQNFVPFEPYLLVEQSVEFETPISEPPLTREEFRARLEGHRSVDAMVQALEAR